MRGGIIAALVLVMGLGTGLPVQANDPCADWVPQARDLHVHADLRCNIWQGPLIGGGVSNVKMRVPHDSAFWCRVDEVTFTGQYAGEAIAIACRLDDDPDGGPTPVHFRYGTVAVENDSLADFDLSGRAGGQMIANVHRFQPCRVPWPPCARGR